MDIQMCLQSIRAEILELRDENRSQNSTIISISEELKMVKKELYIYAKQERHMNSILEIVQSLSQYNQMINETYDKMKLIKEKCDKSIQNKSYSNENIFEKYLAEAEYDASTYNYNDNNMADTLINREKEGDSMNHIKESASQLNEGLAYNLYPHSSNNHNNGNNVTNNSMTGEITIKTEIEDQIEEEYIDESQEINLNNQEMNFIDYPASKPNSNSSNLNSASILSVDTDKISFRCDLCHKIYANPSSLKAHLRIHTGERPFKCDICAQTFIQYGTLKRHLRIHTGEKPFKCAKCPKRFSLSQHLKGHMRTHTGEKPFECSFCSKRFTQSGTLKLHLKTHIDKL